MDQRETSRADAGQSVAHELRAAAPSEQVDVVVVGGGAAGLAAAVALARSRRSVVVVDEGEPRNAPAGHVHNYLGRENVRPAELLASGREEARSYGADVRSGRVVDVRPLGTDGDEPAFRVELADGGSLDCRRVVVATGLVDELPPVDGLAERWGNDVLHCPYCHGYEVRDRRIAVLATGPAAAHQALLFRQLSDDVVVLQHTAPTFADEVLEQFAARGIRVVEAEVVGLELGEHAGERALSGVRCADGSLVGCDALVVAPRFTARASMLGGLGLTADDLVVAGHVLGSAVASDGTGATRVPGVHVAGNVTDLRAQVAAAAAAGLLVGANVNAELVQEDTRRAVAAQRLAGRPVSA